MGDAGVRVGVGAAVFLATLSAYTETLQPSVPGGERRFGLHVSSIRYDVPDVT